MMATEKLVIYFLLLFVLLIIACNILGSIALLVMEKREDVETLKSMGASETAIKRIFLFEGWIIAFFGTLSGLALGLLLCLLQQHFGFIQMPGNFIITAYPIQVQWGDIFSVLGSVGLIGFFAAQISVRFFLPYQNRANFSEKYADAR
jgi:ABC-type lipoprotein release transport system permease subunit